MLLISATFVNHEAIRPDGLSSAIAKMGIQLKGEEPTRISSRWAARREVRIPEMNGRQPRRARHRLLVCSRCKTRSPLPRSLLARLGGEALPVAASTANTGGTSPGLEGVRRRAAGWEVGAEGTKMVS
ncbi:hypothetical protein IscW_ISCW017125 [Ixodes scapularis]|uniref:Uncharacterized protein n=1 Tax=Ixodes scapularis TaxID=6945 RepID=B7P820_IXOSC|nr:hypothetical protein IscW_ISCW017125 [Ixodes scapularis]|eukprot:XP_002400630.1 hypothetical protein IscW_ISCW017125 [Ixodes scapularis]